MDRKYAFEEMVRVLKLGAKLFVSYFNKSTNWFLNQVLSSPGNKSRARRRAGSSAVAPPSKRNNDYYACGPKAAWSKSSISFSLLCYCAMPLQWRLCPYFWINYSIRQSP